MITAHTLQDREKLDSYNLQVVVSNSADLTFNVSPLIDCCYIHGGTHIIICSCNVTSTDYTLISSPPMEATELGSNPDGECHNSSCCTYSSLKNLHALVVFHAAMASVLVTVTDVNDNPPIFVESSLLAAVAEEAEFGTTVTTILVSLFPDIEINIMMWHLQRDQCL